MIVKFLNNSYIALPPTPLTDAMQVERYSWDIMGGPSTLTASAPITVDKWTAFSLLRAPVEVYDEDSKIVWWGYVSKITVPEGAVKFSIGLEDMYNTVAVSYSTASSTDAASKQAATAWNSDTLSVADYGTKEKIITLNDATATTAAYYRDSYLLRYRYPVQNTEFGNAQRVQIECSGWWQTLDWQYYTSTDSTAIDTMTQVSSMITAEGQFFTGVTIDGLTSGLTSPAYRDPFDKQKTVLEDVESFLAVGNSSSQRYVAIVQPSRNVLITAEPTENVQYLMNNDGSIETLNGSPIRPSRCLVGVWLAIKNAPSVQFGTNKVRPVFIESAEYSVSQNKMTPKFAGARDPLDITEMR